MASKIPVQVVAKGIGRFSEYLGLDKRDIGDDSRQPEPIQGAIAKQMLSQLDPKEGWEEGSKAPCTVLNTPLMKQNDAETIIISAQQAKKGNAKLQGSENLANKFSSRFGDTQVSISKKELKRLSETARIITNPKMVPKEFYWRLINDLKINKQDKRRVKDVILQMENGEKLWEKWQLEWKELGFKSLEEFQKVANLPLIMLSSNICHSQELHFFVEQHLGLDGLAYNKLKKGSLEKETPCVLLSTPGINLRYGNLSIDWTDSKGKLSMKDQSFEATVEGLITNMWESILDSAYIQKCENVAIPPIGLGRFLPSNEQDQEKVVSIYFKTLFSLLSSEKYKDKFKNVFYNPLGFGSQFEQEKKAMEEQGKKTGCNIEKFGGDVKFLAVELGKNGYRCALVNPSDADVVFGVYDVGEYWKDGDYVAEEDFAATSTAVLGSSGISDVYRNPAKISQVGSLALPLKGQEIQQKNLQNTAKPQTHNVSNQQQNQQQYQQQKQQTAASPIPSNQQQQQPFKAFDKAKMLNDWDKRRKEIISIINKNLQEASVLMRGSVLKREDGETEKEKIAAEEIITSFNAKKVAAFRSIERELNDRASEARLAGGIFDESEEQRSLRDAHEAEELKLWSEAVEKIKYMGQNIKVETEKADDIDITRCPKAKKLFPGAQITIGDLHGNALKFLFFLVKEGALEIKPEDYTKFVQIYGKSPLVKKDIKDFHSILERCKVNDAAKLATFRLIGDEVGDRGENDYLTLKILEKLNKSHVPVEIIFSNHGLEFIEHYENNFQEPTGTMNEDQGKSAYQLDKLIEDGVITLDDVNTLVKEHYIPAVQAISYSIDEASTPPHLTLFTHAPVGLKTIKALADKFKAFEKHGIKEEEWDKNVYSIAKTIDAINSEFTIQLKNKGKITELLKEEGFEDQQQRGISDVSAPFTSPLIRISWTRKDRDNFWKDGVEVEKDERPSNKNGYSLSYVHGHDGVGYVPEKERGHVRNLDNNLGKDLTYAYLMYDISKAVKPDRTNKKGDYFTHQSFEKSSKQIALKQEKAVNATPPVTAQNVANTARVQAEKERKATEAKAAVQERERAAAQARAESEAKAAQEREKAAALARAAEEAKAAQERERAATAARALAEAKAAQEREKAAETARAEQERIRIEQEKAANQRALAEAARKAAEQAAKEEAKKAAEKAAKEAADKKAADDAAKAAQRADAEARKVADKAQTPSDQSTINVHMQPAVATPIVTPTVPMQNKIPLKKFLESNKSPLNILNISLEFYDELIKETDDKARKAAIYSLFMKAMNHLNKNSPEYLKAEEAYSYLYHNFDAVVNHQKEILAKYAEEYKTLEKKLISNYNNQYYDFRKVLAEFKADTNDTPFEFIDKYILKDPSLDLSTVSLDNLQKNYIDAINLMKYFELYIRAEKLDGILRYDNFKFRMLDFNTEMSNFHKQDVYKWIRINQNNFELYDEFLKEAEKRANQVKDHYLKGAEGRTTLRREAQEITAAVKSAETGLGTGKQTQNIPPLEPKKTPEEAYKNLSSPFRILFINDDKELTNDILNLAMKGGEEGIKQIQNLMNKRMPQVITFIEKKAKIENWGQKRLDEAKKEIEDAYSQIYHNTKEVIRFECISRVKYIKSFENVIFKSIYKNLNNDLRWDPNDKDSISIPGLNDARIEMLNMYNKPESFFDANDLKDISTLKILQSISDFTKLYENAEKLYNSVPDKNKKEVQFLKKNLLDIKINPENLNLKEIMELINDKEKLKKIETILNNEEAEISLKAAAAKASVTDQTKPTAVGEIGVISTPKKTPKVEPIKPAVQQFPVSKLPDWYTLYVGDEKISDETLQIKDLVQTVEKYENVYKKPVLVTLGVPESYPRAKYPRDKVVEFLEWSKSVGLRQKIESAIEEYEKENKIDKSTKPQVGLSSSSSASTTVSPSSQTPASQSSATDMSSTLGALGKDLSGLSQAGGDLGRQASTVKKVPSKVPMYDKQTMTTFANIRDKFAVHSAAGDHEKAFIELQKELKNAKGDQTHALSGITLEKASATHGTMLLARNDTSTGDKYDRATWNVVNAVKTSTINSTAEFQNLVKFALTIGSKKVEMEDYTAGDPSTSRIKILRAIEAFRIAGVELDIGQKNKTLFTETASNKISPQEKELYAVLTSVNPSDYETYQKNHPGRQQGEIAENVIQFVTKKGPEPPENHKNSPSGFH